MANPFNKPISKVSVKQLLSLDSEAVNRLNAKESRTYEKRLRNVAKKRLYTIEKYGKYSPAQERYLPHGVPKASTKSSSRQESQHNIAILREFLNAKSSTLSGIRKIKKETEARIFGRRKNGEPVRQFANTDEEKRFWKAYEEYMHQNPAQRFASTRVQQFLGEETFWKYRDFTAEDFDRIFNQVMNDGANFDIRATAGLDDYI